MGSLVFDKCYPSQAAAADAFFSASEPIVTSGATAYLSWFEPSATGWLLKRQAISENGVTTALPDAYATVPAFPVCDEMSTFNDGLMVGWLVAAMLLVVWGLNHVMRLIR